MLKTGWKTTEFWATFLSNAGAFMAGFAGLLTPKWAAFLITGSTIAYTISRGLAKGTVKE